MTSSSRTVNFLRHKKHAEIHSINVITADVYQREEFAIIRMTVVISQMKKVENFSEIYAKILLE